MERWDGGDAYELFMGRWSHEVATVFVGELAKPDGLKWLDVGCGTGALLNVIATQASPSAISGVDPSPEFLATAADRLGRLADLHVADGEHLPFDDDSFDVVVSGLALNFMPDPEAAVKEWRRVTAPGGVVSAYVWDYADGMQFLRSFWDAAIALDPAAESLDEARRFPVCQPDALGGIFEASGLANVTTSSVEVPTVFSDFDDYWSPFLLGQGPAPSYTSALAEPARDALKQRLREMLEDEGQSQISLSARAWTVTGHLR